MGNISEPCCGCGDKTSNKNTLKQHKKKRTQMQMREGVREEKETDDKVDCESINDCMCLKRIIKGLNFYSELNLNDKSTEHKLVKFCTETLLLNDFIHILLKHNNENDLNCIYDNIIDKNCNMQDCKCVERYHRDRKKDSNNISATDLNYIFYNDIMDQCHCFLFHLYDMALRYKPPVYDNNIHDVNTNDENDINLTDIMFTDMHNTLNKIIKANDLNKYTINQSNKYLISNNETGEKISEDTFIDIVINRMNNSHISPQTIKHFVSEIEAEEYDSDAIMDDINNIDNSNIKCYCEQQKYGQSIPDVLSNCTSVVNLYKRTFSPGYTFYYWDYYNKPSFKPTQWWLNRNDHSGYMENELYIKKKYNSLKEEIMNNTIHRLGIKHIKISMTKAEQYSNTKPVKSMKTECPFGLYYGIKNGLPFTRDNILSIILYTDFDDLQRAFSETFRRKYSYESINSVKARNAEYANWSKLLRETIECFGQKGYEGDLHDTIDKVDNAERNRQQGPFFCGMSMVFVFPSFNIRLCGPTSTSTESSVATRFSQGDGIIMALNNYGYISSCELRSFDCHWLSNYGGESEILWMGGHWCIKIENITNIRTKNSFKEYCEAFFYFDCCIKGMHFEDFHVNVKQEYYSLLNNLVNKSGLTCYRSYVHDTFECLVKNTKSVVINLDTLNTVLKTFKSLLVDYNNILKPIIFDLFVNCKNIIIYTTDSFGQEEYKIDLSLFISTISTYNMSDIIKNLTITIIGKWDYFDETKCSWIRNEFTWAIKHLFNMQGYTIQLYEKKDNRYSDDIVKKEDHLIIKKS